MDKKLMLTGLQPTGTITLGNSSDRCGHTCK